MLVAKNPPPPAPAQEPLIGDLPEHKTGNYNLGELTNLSIRRGTLTAEEREKINDHIVVTIKMLEQLPFPALPAICVALFQSRIKGQTYEQFGTGQDGRLGSGDRD